MPVSEIDEVLINLKVLESLEINKKNPLNNWTEIFLGNLISFLKKIKAKGKLTRIIKKYLPQIICIKCISEDKYLAIPSIKGNKSQPDIFKT